MLRDRTYAVEIPSIHDRLTDAGCRGTGVADERPGDDDSGNRHDTDDPQFVADMMQREAAHELGYTDALCGGCGCLIYVEVSSRAGGVLCPACSRAGDDTDPPPAAAMPVPPEMLASAAKYTDGQLIEAIVLADEEPHVLALQGRERAAWLSAMTSEVLRRVA